MWGSCQKVWRAGDSLQLPFEVPGPWGNLRHRTVSQVKQSLWHKYHPWEKMTLHCHLWLLGVAELHIGLKKCSTCKPVREIFIFDYCSHVNRHTRPWVALHHVLLWTWVPGVQMILPGKQQSSTLCKLGVNTEHQCPAGITVFIPVITTQYIFPFQGCLLTHSVMEQTNYK